MPKTAYTIQCGNVDCQKSFPIVVETDPASTDPEAPTTKEVSCPFCKILLTVDFQQPLKPDSFVLRGDIK
jgi:hypothetical protein